MSRRADKRDRTRSRIERSGLTLFERDGFDPTSVRDVAAAAGVSRRTVYRYFARKEDIVFAEAGSDLRVLLDALEGRPRSELPLVALREAILGSIGHFSRDLVADRTRVVARSPELQSRALVLREAWSNGLAGALARRSGDDVPTAEQRLAAAAAVYALGLAMATWRDDGGAPADLAATARRMFGALERLLGQRAAPA